MFFGLLAIFIIVSLILPWVNLSRIITLEKENREIRALLLNKEKTPQPIIDEGGIVKKPQHQESFSAISEPNVGGIKRKITDISPHHATSPIPLISESPAAKKVSFEQRFGKRLPVWIGGIALAFAGLFMVKYSIDAGILTAGLRVILGVAFGIVARAKWCDAFRLFIFNFNGIVFFDPPKKLVDTWNSGNSSLFFMGSDLDVDGRLCD
jgi:hypothetical protein